MMKLKTEICLGFGGIEVWEGKVKPRAEGQNGIGGLRSEL